ncbi:GNAT family N-acetyltransferase [Tissierella pigra]|uniref:GNAT family N-acetyltransferase n=1 Tax=Tissierella pigra TaxID=2607614 RepID=A0A6N7Y110_9FIRM|nr:GNAT family N-acetyltransferase [Tissierella pigra]MBU5424961.1 GNAT family N-acetyltransferase [Tissierella pigra]MSU02534.1 GNAT family N-acetyltransferase [Tissierella pigra]
MLPNNIISERLILRDMMMDDSKDVWEIWSNSENERYMSDPVESQDEIVSIFDTDDRNGYLTVAILKDTDEIIGTCCFGPTDRNDEWGFGYSIRQEHWNKGYATEIVKSVIEFGYSSGIKDFIASCAIENTASGKVMEKCGMYIDHKGSFRQPKLDIVYESNVYKLHID